jgi:hypothetical protein
VCENPNGNRRSLHSATPDFLWNLVALTNIMRLSVKKGAHAALSSAAWQEIRVRSGRKTFPGRVRRTADPSAPPDFLSRVVASINCMWFSLGRTTQVVAGKSSEVGNPGTLGMTKGRVVVQWKVVAGLEAFFITLGGPEAHDHSGRDDNSV